MSYQSQGYQGYPYSQPAVLDVPSLDRTREQWTDLPRTQVRFNKEKKEIQNVVYSDPPHTEETDIGSPTGSKELVNDQPVVYIDIPGNEDAGDISEEEAQNPPGSSKQDLDEHPVVYIELPDSEGSELVQNDQGASASEPEFVQETIFFDPFDNRRIDDQKEERGLSSNEGGPSRPVRPAPARPTSLDVTPVSVPGSSTSIRGPGIRSPVTSPGTRPGLPASMADEVYIYQGSNNEDGFSLTPLPVTDFPEPPPAYNEIDPVTPPQPVVEQPRTEVIVTPGAALPMANNSNRKNLYCHHCGLRVNSLMVRQIGAATHIVAMSCLMLCLFPFTLAVYCLDCCKYKNHYCPNCNKLIGYEVPMLCQKMVYSK